jgi:pyrimidine oxygenase
MTPLAEFLGFDFVLSPQHWRGAQGPTRFWGDTVESIAATGALLQATQRINVWCTMHTNVHHPRPSRRSSRRRRRSVKAGST